MLHLTRDEVMYLHSRIVHDNTDTGQQLRKRMYDWLLYAQVADDAKRTNHSANQGTH